MSKNGKLIFKTFDPSITSPFGYRIHPIDKVRKFHQGVDYGTNGVKVAQYAIEDGVVTGCGTDSTGAKYVYVKYPRLNKTGLHYHLDRYCVSNGQNVNSNTIIGYTGATGRVTGIHLHFGWFPTEDRNKSWNEKRWEDFEAYNYVAPSQTNKKTVDELAQEVIAGKWGNYPERKTRLESAGYNYSEVQRRVNELVNGNTKKYIQINTTSGVWCRTGGYGFNAPKYKVIPYQTKCELVAKNVGNSNGYSWDKVIYEGKTVYLPNKWNKYL